MRRSCLSIANKPAGPRGTQTISNHFPGSRLMGSIGRLPRFMKDPGKGMCVEKSVGEERVVLGRKATCMKTSMDRSERGHDGAI